MLGGKQKMDEEKIQEYLEALANQLNTTAQEAFRIVSQRVFAESLISLVVCLLVAIPATWALVRISLWLRKELPTGNGDELFSILPIGGLGFVVAAALGQIVKSAINLFSLEYATIERILELIGRAT
jgi:hypothetical protein